jgi:hypothetical protein
VGIYGIVIKRILNKMIRRRELDSSGSA